MVPKIVIIGRPNVGKSSLLNMLAGRLISIVDPTPGVTRDRVSTFIELPADFESSDPKTYHAELVDTGGYGVADTQDLTADIERQIGIGMAEADLILFVIDGQSGLVPLDQEIARLLRGSSKTARRKVGAKHADLGTPVLLVANKIDSSRYEAGAAEAGRLGLGEPVMVSAVSGHNKHALVEAIRVKINWAAYADADSKPDLGMLLAIVGKRNAGKSTLVNALAGRERMIVSQLEGTTRDAVDVRFEINGQVFTAIDTAGLRRRKSVHADVEYYSQHRALKSIRRADVVLLLIDATLPVSHVDERLSGEVLEHYKPTIVVVNKWDLAEGQAEQDKFVAYLTKTLKGLDFAPLAFVSAKKSEGLEEVLAMARNLYQQANHRVSTSELNEVFEKIMAERPPTSGIGRRVKIYYVTQTGVAPPTIALFVNDPTMFDPMYLRYLMGRLRELLPFAEVPIRLVIRGKRPENTEANPKKKRK